MGKPTRVLAVDPGKTTGWATWQSLKKPPLSGELEGPMEFLGYALTWADAHKGRGIVVAERFIITPETAKKTQAPWSLEVSGALRFMAHRFDLKFVQQSPAEAKRLIHDQRLKNLDWWQPGKGHANDALRHLAYYLAYHRVLRLPPSKP